MSQEDQGTRTIRPAPLGQNFDLTMEPSRLSALHRYRILETEPERCFDDLAPTREFSMTIPADPAAIPIVTDGVVEVLEERRWPEEDVQAVELALQEALANAIRHGCGGDASKHVQCSVNWDETGEVIIVVRDPGPGFDPRAVADPLDPANALKPNGRGLFLINELMDRVQFADSGREVQMRKRRAPDRMPVSE